MLNTTTFVGLDARALDKGRRLDAMTGEVTRPPSATTPPRSPNGWDPRPCRKVRLSRRRRFDSKEAFTALGVDCVIGAVSKMIKPPADRKRKNDRNDAEFLARMLRGKHHRESGFPTTNARRRDLVRALTTQGTT